MNCPSIRTLLSDYLDGELPAERHAAVDRHLLDCGGCSRLLSELRDTVRLTGHLGRHSCPVDLRAAVMSSVAARPARRPVHTFFRATLAISLGGSTMLACLSLPFMLQRAPLQTRPQDSPAVTPLPAAPVHLQYDMAHGLGTTDGLLLSLSATKPRPDALGGRAEQP
ncbi:MAG: putative transrane anti-sigma factor [Armatimonadetes bacterium]|jgi:anti-sigma factor RsiW|nr:putative transrane anti-sigma factor [Armatimonadota bacterium]